ncbi:hypothetical protein C8R46DRAFT_1214791 [Mycena filopes]|nr:hypothetical protein C8R46DRAFT_1214791 [Mycena filopes]
MARNSGNTAARNFAPGMYGPMPRVPARASHQRVLAIKTGCTPAYRGFWRVRTVVLWSQIAVQSRFNVQLHFNLGWLTHLIVTSQSLGTVTMLVRVEVTRPDSPLPLKVQVQPCLALDILALSRSPIDAQTSGCRSYHPLNPGLISGHRPTLLGMGPQTSGTDTLLASSKLFNQLHLRSRRDGPTHTVWVSWDAAYGPASGYRTYLTPAEWAFGPRFGSLETQTLLAWVQVCVR